MLLGQSLKWIFATSIMYKAVIGMTCIIFNELFITGAMQYLDTMF